MSDELVKVSVLSRLIHGGGFIEVGEELETTVEHAAELVKAGVVEALDSAKPSRRRGSADSKD